ncbi:RNA-directed DNA polymerase from mobile element [Brachionus plicatilis]|uniref:RNA-directed DNA polymerase from mobile element n=1 Tax=Brachionus plicatilis TaxID=10195 RepID=A0A3M7T9F3_BRAPC|nr:RNA-directed DNA polymerase from mobile element [Brachionus plicatilis]
MASLLYSARLELVSPLVTIFNHCVNNGIVIDEWRLGNITPIPKVQNPATPSDMRPIAITSTPCKIMERIITKQILRLVRLMPFNAGVLIIRLNVGKCKVIFINPPRVLGSSVPTVYLLGQMLETVKCYKYLGFELSDSLDLDLQWRRVRSIVSPVEFLLKQLKLNGWSTPMLICVYRAYCLNHFTYSAVMLTSTSAAAKCEMNDFNSRLWRIMGIDDQTGGCYKLLPIAEFIDHFCEQTLNRILADPNHPITSCQPRNLRLNARFHFQTRKANKAAYRNSFLQKFLRKLRNDSNSQNARASLYLIQIHASNLGKTDKKSLPIDNNTQKVKNRLDLNKFEIEKLDEYKKQFNEKLSKVTEVDRKNLSEINCSILIVNKSLNDLTENMIRIFSNMAQLSNEFFIHFNKNFETLNGNLEKLEQNFSTTHFVASSNYVEMVASSNYVEMEKESDLVQSFPDLFEPMQCSLFSTENINKKEYLTDTEIQKDNFVLKNCRAEMFMRGRGKEEERKRKGRGKE